MLYNPEGDVKKMKSIFWGGAGEEYNFQFKVFWVRT